MALIKKITLPSGHVCEYWRVIEVQTRHLSKDGAVTIIGYKDKAARDAGLQPLADSSQTFYGFNAHGGTTDAYEWLKSLTEDVPETMKPNPEYDPEQAPYMMGGDAEGNPASVPNPNYKPQFLVVPAHKVPGIFADAKSDA